MSHAVARPGADARTRNWRVHIGAHKTATTHLQNTLGALASDLAGFGVAVIPTQPNREVARKAARRRSGFSGLLASLYLRLSLVPRLRRHGTCAPIVVYSEEDILGTTNDLLNRQFYPNLSGLDLLSMLTKGDALDVFISVRSYDTLLSSAYFQILRVKSLSRTDLTEAATRMLAGHGGWPELLRRIADRLPAARLHFWCYEDYAVDPWPLVSKLIGVDVPSRPDVAVPTGTRSPSSEALAEIERLDPCMPRQDRLASVIKIYSQFPAAAVSPAPLIDPELTQALRGLYARHLAELRKSYSDAGLS